MSYNFYKKIRAFSLIETLIAVSILMIAIAGPLSLVQAGLFSSIHQRNQVTATYLAQEALEFIKNIRDTNSYTQYSDPNGVGVPWLTISNGLSLIDICSGGCYVDPHGYLPLVNNNDSTYFQTATDVSPESNLYLNQTKIGDVVSYSYDTDTINDHSVVSPYKRTVVITPVPADAGPTAEEVTVTVTINWKDNALPRSYTVSTNLFNYQIADSSSGIDSSSGTDSVVTSSSNCLVSYQGDLIQRSFPLESAGGDYNISYSVTNGDTNQVGTIQVVGGDLRNPPPDTFYVSINILESTLTVVPAQTDAPFTINLCISPQS